MKSKVLILIGSTFSFFAAQSNTLQKPEADTTLWDIVPKITLERTIYTGAGLAVCYGGYKVLSNETLIRNMKALYNFLTTGSVVSESEIQAKKARRDEKRRAQKEVAATLEGHTHRLLTLQATLDILKENSAQYVTKKDLEQLATKADIQALHAKLDTVIQQTKGVAFAEGLFASRNVTYATA
ncbi:MAG: hypothetical protein K2X90_01240 [Candidatus Babeliaceae bacterium]|nr:hypothetical protein [Candidatus Babeliaceae bacterium]